MPDSVKFTLIKGSLPKLKPDNLKRVAAYLVQGPNVLAKSDVTAAGTFEFRVIPSVVIDPCVFVVLAPEGADDQFVLTRTDLPRAVLSGERANVAKAHFAGRDVLTINFPEDDINDRIVEAWPIWCYPYTVSGTLLTANGCPIPGAEVTVYNVSPGFGGLSETTLATVQTNAAGQFTATFEWCRFFPCWPCLPFWWHCWPWYWELDILEVIQVLERQTTLSVAQSNPAPLNRPSAAALLTGQGFARENTALKPDPARTALITSKLANPKLREIFPWWWWCCENPNIVFSATQNGNTILNEDPAVSTRWCFASGQSVSLTGNSLSLGVCGGPIVCEGFSWTQVGSTLISQITNGYANGTPGSDAADMAFAGTLNIYGAFADPTIPLYQVLAGLWSGNRNPARGGIAPVAPNPLSLGLSSNVFIFRAGGGGGVEIDEVVLGPCSLGSLSNLYVTTSYLSTNHAPPAGVTGLPAPGSAGGFPILNPGDFVIGWANAGLMVSASASALIGGASGGGVDLTAIAYDAAGTEIALSTDVPLTLMIDTTGITARIDPPLQAFDVNGNPVSLSGSSTTECPAYHIGPKGYLLLHVTVTDPDPSPTLSLNEHLYAYEINSQFGHGSSSVPTTPAHRGYAQSPATFTSPSPGQLYGVDAGYGPPDHALVSFIGGGDTILIQPQVSCCYDFQLWAGKRVTDGQTFFSTWVNYDFQTATIDVS